MKRTVLIYIEKNHQYLMLYRNKKEHDLNALKWIGIGGHIEEGETPLEAIYREVKEETGLTLLNCQERGLVHFKYDDVEEDMYVYTSCSAKGNIIECDEGELHWVDIDKLSMLPMWEGDKVFLELLMNGVKGFEITLNYVNGKLIETIRHK